jgi:TetR/AcrR family transcriptional regulator, cholesterol catabolism regulator
MLRCYRTIVRIVDMATRREELVATAARLFAERGFHGTSMADLAEAMGVQKGSLYSLTGSKQELLVAVTRDGARAFHAALDRVPEDGDPLERIRLALRGHLAVVAAQVDAATVFTREWRFLDEPERTAFRDERRRYEERWRSLLREAAERGALRVDLDAEATVLLVLSAANWAYTWIRPDTDTDELADRFFAILVDGVRGYAPRPA